MGHQHIVDHGHETPHEEKTEKRKERHTVSRGVVGHVLVFAKTNKKHLSKKIRGSQFVVFQI
jgi:hypothetical protein